jgi:hypothetical protein
MKRNKEGYGPRPVPFFAWIDRRVASFPMTVSYRLRVHPVPLFW